MTFTVGQRWISNTESQLGLGIITDISGRQVSVHFPAAEEHRIYAKDNAPLSRIICKKDEEVLTQDQKKLIIASSQEHQGLLIYRAIDAEGQELQITELDLDCNIVLNTPKQRLFSGLLDKLEAFKLRIDTLHHLGRLQQSKIRGLIGSRTNHLPHQIYIAHEVAKRYAPRVLLADEVGLGKTIEAGMIIHYQLHTARAQRIVLIVPDPLIHQWLVEFIRKFNLYFTIIDEHHFIQQPSYSEEDEIPLEEEFGSLSNPFENEQLVLCGLNFLMNHQKAREALLESDWDLLLVDEAHHLHWTELKPSDEYLFIQNLSHCAKGLLLLTATPEHVGIESHFARLKLLDPSRFYDFSVFKKEEARYQELNVLVQKLLAYQEKEQTDCLNKELTQELFAYLGDDTVESLSKNIRNLLDRHGTGRLLFRNTRAAIQGFPKRLVYPYPLPSVSIYSKANLYPETQLDPSIWLELDPRVSWLTSKISELHPKKILILCANSSTAIALEQHLKLKISITVFHEGMSIVERDRAAAYFTEQEEGAQVLICSEIGSEGRNFQCSHHLVLFDLPLNPDLLEQRIGRLDRIGQKHPIHIHVPYLLDSAHERLFRWYQEGLNVFHANCSVGFSIYEHFEERLKPLLEMTADFKLLDPLIEDTKTFTENILQTLQEGRDRLLELNSCNLEVAETLIKQIEAEENNLELEGFMTRIFHEYGVDQEYHSDSCEILYPGAHMKTGYFPGLKDDGTTITYSRAKALIREDMEFLSFEHPMVTESMEMLLHSETGNACLATISVKSVAPGTLFVETFYTVNCAAPKSLQLDRYLPWTPIRILMDISGKNLSAILDYNKLNSMCSPVKGHLGYPIMKEISKDVEHILAQSTQKAEQTLKDLCEKARSEMTEELSQEASRLEALQKNNPAIRNEEIEFFKGRIEENKHYIDSATLKIQAIRVIINS